MEPVAKINWKWLTDTIKFWENKGFQYVEVPWLVTKEAIRHTFDGLITPVFQDLYVVGSGEQSFLQLELEEKLKPGKYITMTPCFREEEKLSDITQPHFMKAELYVTEKLIYNCDLYLASDAIYNMNKLVRLANKQCNFEILQTSEGYDVLSHGIEVGSYGVREYDGHKWLYGTALAEPRFSTMCNR